MLLSPPILKLLGNKALKSFRLLLCPPNSYVVLKLVPRIRVDVAITAINLKTYENWATSMI